MGTHTAHTPNTIRERTTLYQSSHGYVYKNSTENDERNVLCIVLWTDSNGIATKHTIKCRLSLKVT